MFLRFCLFYLQPVFFLQCLASLCTAVSIESCGFVEGLLKNEGKAGIVLIHSSAETTTLEENTSPVLII